MDPTPVLIIDDSEEDAFLVRRALNGGYACEHALDLPDALEVLETLRPQLIVLDLYLPSVGARLTEGVRTVRQAAPLVPILVLSGGPLDPALCGALVEAGGPATAISDKRHADQLAAVAVALLARHRLLLAQLDGATLAGRSADQAETRDALKELRDTVAEVLAVLRNPPPPWWWRGLAARADQAAAWWGGLSPAARGGYLAVLGLGTGGVGWGTGMATGWLKQVLVAALGFLGQTDVVVEVSPPPVVLREEE